MSLQIEIIGPANVQRDLLHQRVLEVVSQYEIEATIEITATKEAIQKYLLMSTPALVAEGSVVINGRVPEKEEIIELLS
ncbi:MAG: thioredoxin family protein [Flavobacteriaceae bacterium]|nr:thioredoxin family protein [Flavobacteriaceae bacterium]